MKNTLLFWLSLFFLGPAVFSGAYFIDKKTNEKPVKNTRESEIVTKSQESDCIERLLNDVRPLINPVICDNPNQFN